MRKKKTKKRGRKLIATLHTNSSFIPTWRDPIRLLHQSHFSLFSDYFDICSAANPITRRHKSATESCFVLLTSSALSIYAENYELSRSGCWCLILCPLIGLFFIQSRPAPFSAISLLLRKSR